MRQSPEELARATKDRLPKAFRDGWFVVEPGHGETYSHGRPVLYAYDTYPSGSVLAGRQRRTYVEEIPEDMVAGVVDAFRALGADIEASECTGHIPVADMVAHLPDEDGNL